MSQSPPNPTAPILLVLVTVLFAVTWSHDQARAATCPQPPVTAIVAPREVIQPVSVIDSRTDTRVVTVAVHVALRPAAEPQELPEQQPRLPEWVRNLRSAESSADVESHEDWLTTLLGRAEWSIIR